jgi:hypothetical protein
MEEIKNKKIKKYMIECIYSNLTRRIKDKHTGNILSL